MKVISKNEVINTLREVLVGWRYNEIDCHRLAWEILAYLPDKEDVIVYGDLSRFLDGYVSSKMASMQNQFISTFKGEIIKKCYDEQTSNNSNRQTESSHAPAEDKAR